MQEKVAALARLVSWAGHGPGGLDWAEIERQVGIALPASFKEYVSVFPPGTFQDYVIVAGPRSSTDAGYPERVQNGLRALRVLKRPTPGFTSSSFISIPYDVFPRIPGLLPWGRIGLDRVLCWHMLRDGEESPQVVLVDEGERRVVELPGDMVDCITDIITGRYPEFDYIAEEFDPPRFVPLKLPPADSGRAPRRTSDHADLDPSGLLTVPLSKADAVSELLQLRGAAASPRTVDWPALERHLRHPLPADYKRFMELVGPGTYGDITVADPADSGDTPSLLDLTREALDGLNTDAEHPLPQGPIAWGRAPDGWYCGWVPGAYPDDQRPILLFHPLRRNAQGRGGSMTSYLAEHTQAPTNWDTARWRVGEP